MTDISICKKYWTESCFYYGFQVHSEDHDTSSQGQSPSGIKPRKWLEGVRLCGYATSSDMALNIILIIIAGWITSRHSGGFKSATLYQGSYSTAKKTTIGLHLVTSVPNTIILAASGNCMQGLAIPSKGEIDRAHAKRMYLHVGTNSLRNLGDQCRWYLSRARNRR